MIAWEEMDPMDLMENTHPNERKYPDLDWETVAQRLWAATLNKLKNRTASLDPEERLRFQGLLGNIYWLSGNLERQIQSPVRIWERNGEVRTGHSAILAHAAVQRPIRVHYCKAPLCSLQDFCPEFEPKPVQKLEQLSGNVALWMEN